MSFSLKILTPDGSVYDGEAERIVCRTIEGDVCIMAHHIDYCTAIGMGPAHVADTNGVRYAACMGGMLSVLNGNVRLLATTWEWSDEIDVARAEASRTRAEAVLKQGNADARTIELAQARLKRALVRTSVAH